MSYVDKHLMAGERVVYRTHRHWVIFRRPGFVLLIGILLFIGGRFWKQEPDAAIVGNYAIGVAALLALVIAIPAWIDRATSQFAVTDKRALVKVGWVSR